MSSKTQNRKISKAPSQLSLLCPFAGTLVQSLGHSIDSSTNWIAFPS